MSISIIEFSVENFKIFKDLVTFSMLSRKGEHTFNESGQNLLKTSLIYGPNASGKTTMLNAFSLLKSVMIGSANNLEGANLPYDPFVLSEVSGEPSFFEVIFILDGKTFKYNFSLLRHRVVKENLCEIVSAEKEKDYLIRDGEKIKLFGEFKKSEDVITKTRKEVLFLSAASQWNNNLAMRVVRGIQDINVISGHESGSYGGFTMNLFKDNNEKKERILKMLKKADFCIDDGVVEKIEIPDSIKEKIPSEFKDIPKEVDTISFSHKKFDSKRNVIGVEKFNIGSESVGTRKFFEVLGPVLDTLESGKVLFIDEFDNSLHPLLTKLVIDLFEKDNPKNAQLIVTTHDTSLLSYKSSFCKDQFWFTEKDQYGVGSLFSLAEFDLRNDTEFAKKYLEGRFGALPFISNE